MDRPTGVTVLAVLNFLGAALYILLGVLFMVGMGALGAVLGQSGQEGSGAAMGLLMGLGAVAGVVLIFFGLIALAIGIGLWKLKNWARIITIVLSALGGLACLAGLLGGVMAAEIISIIVNVIFLGIYGLIIWYLFQAHVKQAFGVS